MRHASLASKVALLGVTLFWVGIFVAAVLEPGYVQRSDYVSSLASRGSKVAPIGIAAIASMGAAFIAGGFETQRAWGRRALMIPMALSGAALFVVAAFRTNCPGGAAGCGFGPAAAAPDWIQALHVYGVVVNEVSLVIAMIVLALVLVRTSPWPRWLGAVSIPLAFASVGLLLRTGGENNGLYQRSWVAVNSVWLLLAVWMAMQVEDVSTDVDVS